MNTHCAGSGSSALCGADYKAADDFITSYMAIWDPVHERQRTPADHGINCPACIALLARKTHMNAHDYEDLTDCPICPQLATDRDEALTIVQAALDEAVRWEHLARLEYEASGRWQEMAEDLWEELQEWHADDCPTGDTPDVDCTCHRILAARWDEITHAADWADDDEVDE